MNRKGKLAAKNRFEVFTEIYKGGLPEYWINEPDRNMFFESYISTYLEKDVSRLIIWFPSPFAPDPIPAKSFP